MYAQETCREIADGVIVLEGDFYDPVMDTYSTPLVPEPPPEPEEPPLPTPIIPTPEERIALLQAQAAQYDQLIVDLAYSVTLLELGVM